MIKAIIFDLDNTLVDFMKMKELAVEGAIEAMIDAGLKMEKQRAKEKIYEIYKEEGIEYQMIFDKFLQQELGRIDYKMHAAGIVAYRKAREAALVTYPHTTLTLVELLKRGLKLAVVSDAPRREAWLRLCYLGLQNLVDCVVTFEDTGEKKPLPTPFQKVLSLLNLSPKDCLMVGDWAERDIVGAAKLGMKTAFARYGDTFGTKESGADYELNDIIELLEIVDRENNAENAKYSQITQRKK
ncbi:MAG: HAD-IA family hydrolase [Candidatus Edwardsbacteria bacterium]